MPVDYNGLTRNSWPGTFSPSSFHPIVLDREIRGSLRTIAGTSGDQLTDISGQRLEDGMLVYLQSGYISGSYIRSANTYYKYSILSGQVRNSSTGSLPNSEANWTAYSPNLVAGTGVTLVTNPTTGAITINTAASASLNDLSNVLITDPSAGQVLKFNGTAWVNDTDLTDPNQADTGDDFIYALIFG
jgi:hypothetical protein